QRAGIVFGDRLIGDVVFSSEFKVVRDFILVGGGTSCEPEAAKNHRRQHDGMCLLHVTASQGKPWQNTPDVPTHIVSTASLSQRRSSSGWVRRMSSIVGSGWSVTTSVPQV